MTEPLTAESEALLGDLIAAFSDGLSTPDTMDALIRPALAAIEAAARAPLLEALEDIVSEFNRDNIARAALATPAEAPGPEALAPVEP